MKKLFSLIAVLLITVSSYAQWSESALYMTKPLSKEAIKTVYARTSGGEISVTGVNESEARLEVYIRSNNNRDNLSKDEIKKRLDEDYDLEVSVDGGKVSAVAKPKHFSLNSRRMLNVGFRFFVPKNSTTDVSTSGGSIALSHLAGEQNFSTSGGGLNIDDVSGGVYGKTSGGGISIANSRDMIDLSTSGGGVEAVNCSGTIKLSTSGGTITLEKLKGSIKANTSGGTVRGSDIKGELIAHTSGGSINLKDISGSVDVSTSGGNIDMEIDELGKYVTASNSGGNIDLKLPRGKGVDLKLRGEHIRMSDVENFSGDKEDHKVTGKVNGGGIPVNVSTSGSINLGVH